MLNKEDKNPGKGCLIFSLILFGLATIKPLTLLIFGASYEEIQNSVSFDRTTGYIRNDVDYLRFCFILVIIAICMYAYNHIKKYKND